ncbi:MAG: hypothetical protein GX657_13810 [Chloroflexi bacterium]|nr:hypothetical protein [Chloroflexota bacterium]
MATAKQTAARQVLAGVPRIGYDVHLSPFPGALYSWLQFMGDPADYNYLMGVTGACFRRLWNRDDGGNVDLMYLAPEPYARALRALGYSWREVPNTDRAGFLAAVRKEVAAGRPLLVFGLIGPPEAGLVTGYDAGGEVLIGWSYFQDMPDQAGRAGREPSGYYRLEGWRLPDESHGGIAALIIGEKGPRPDARKVFLSSLEWAVDLARTPVRPGLGDHASGLAAYEAWAAGLEADADYPAGNAEVLATRTMVHGDQAVMLEERHNAAAYLRAGLALLPEAGEALAAAAAHYERAAGEMDAIWLWGADMGPRVGRALVSADTRRSIARHIRLARDAEATAVEHLERALRAAGR